MEGSRTRFLDQQITFLAVSMVWSALLLVISIVTHFPYAALVLFPLPLVLFKVTAWRAVVLVVMGYTAFFDPLQAHTLAGVLLVPESALFIFVVLYLSAQPKRAVPRIPQSLNMLLLLLFCGYAILMTLPTFLVMGFDTYVVNDLKSILVLLLVPLLLRDGFFEPRKLIALLFLLVIFSTVFALGSIVYFLIDQGRVITWNEIYFGVGFVLSVILRRQLKKHSARIVLTACGTVLAAALVLTQTRGLWIAVFLALIVYGAFSVRSFRFSDVAKRIVPFVASLAVLTMVLSLVFQFNLITFVQNRFMQNEKNELATPTSSMGYRLYECYTVYQHATFLGHGSGARLHIYMPFINKNKAIEWWAIHSEYFEVLHKYGYFGLALFLALLVTTTVKAFRLACSPRFSTKIYGYVALTTMLILVELSITSGYIRRPNSVYLTMLVIGMVEYYYPRRKVTPEKLREIEAA